MLRVGNGTEGVWVPSNPNEDCSCNLSASHSPFPNASPKYDPALMIAPTLTTGASNKAERLHQKLAFGSPK